VRGKPWKAWRNPPPARLTSPAGLIAAFHASNVVCGNLWGKLAMHATVGASCHQSRFFCVFFFSLTKLHIPCPTHALPTHYVAGSRLLIAAATHAPTLRSIAICSAAHLFQLLLPHSSQQSARHTCSRPAGHSLVLVSGLRSKQE
jgi:hypothetical protein